jgi:hypothetical protein
MSKGRDILIDGGPDPRRIKLEVSEKLPFWDRTIDLVACTQRQADHVTGLVGVLQRYNIERVLPLEYPTIPPSIRNGSDSLRPGKSRAAWPRLDRRLTWGAAL